MLYLLMLEMFQLDVCSASYGQENDLRSCKKCPKDTNMGPHIFQWPWCKTGEENKQRRGVEKESWLSGL